MTQVRSRRSDVLVSDEELASVRSEVHAIHGAVQAFNAITESGETVQLPAEVTQIIRAALNALATHGTVTVGTMPEELTSNTAAEVLGVSRPTLLKMARNDEIASFKVGSHTRFRREDVLAMKERREAERGRLLDEILDIENQLTDPS